MENRPVIMVQVAESEWTLDVLHAACRLARTCNGAIALVHMVCVRRLMYLGSDLGYMDVREEDTHTLALCVDTVEDYGLPCHVTLYQHCGLYEAIVAAAEVVGATFVYANLPKSAIPFWRECQFELLRMRLSRQHIKLFNEPGVWGTLTSTAQAPKQLADAHRWE